MLARLPGLSTAKVDRWVILAAALVEKWQKRPISSAPNTTCKNMSIAAPLQDGRGTATLFKTRRVKVKGVIRHEHWRA